MREVKRYECEDTSRDYMHSCGMEEDSLGDYVKYSDYQKLKAQLERAEKVLDFYSDCGNWGHISYDKADYVVILNDSGVGDFQISDITDDDRVGGLRAREYFKEKEQV